MKIQTMAKAKEYKNYGTSFSVASINGGVSIIDS